MKEDNDLREEFKALKKEMASMKGWARVKRNLITLLVVVAVPMAIYAITKQFTFTAGTVAKASEINKNFDDIYARLDAMEGKSWRLIYENDITVSTTSITISALDGDKDLRYQIITKFVGGAGGVATFRIRPNNDTTNANYGYQDINGQGGTASGSQGTSAADLRIGSADSGQINNDLSMLMAKSGTSRSLLSIRNSQVSGTTIVQTSANTSLWNNTGTNITSLVIYSDMVNGIGAGSHIEIWARR